MRAVVCLCGHRIEADDVEALNAAFWAHTEQRHSNVSVSRERRDHVSEALRRTGGWDGARAERVEHIDIRRLSPQLAGDYLTFFDGPALADNPVWASCYCLSYELDLPVGQFDERPAALNRAEKAARIERGASRGVLAYADGTLAGWCHAAPRASLPMLDRTPDFSCDEPGETGCIVCFVVAPAYRGNGIARRLLDGACGLVRDLGLRRIEVYPAKAATTAAASYHGRPEMYRAAGFEDVRDTGRYLVMRRAL